MSCKNYGKLPNGYQYFATDAYILPEDTKLNKLNINEGLERCKEILEKETQHIVHIGNKDSCLGSNHGGWFKSLPENGNNNDRCYVLAIVGKHVNGNNYGHEWHIPINNLKAWNANQSTKNINNLCKAATWTDEWLKVAPKSKLQNVDSKNVEMFYEWNSNETIKEVEIDFSKDDL